MVVTVPLGVLKGRSVQAKIQFEPPLPPWKLEAIQQLGFGIENKVILLFEEVFWPADPFFNVAVRHIRLMHFRVGAYRATACAKLVIVLGGVFFFLLLSPSGPTLSVLEPELF